MERLIVKRSNLSEVDALSQSIIAVLGKAHELLILSGLGKGSNRKFTQLHNYLWLYNEIIMISMLRDQNSPQRSFLSAVVEMLTK